MPASAGKCYQQNDESINLQVHYRSTTTILYGQKDFSLGLCSSQKTIPPPNKACTFLDHISWRGVRHQNDHAIMSVVQGNGACKTGGGLEFLLPSGIKTFYFLETALGEDVVVRRWNLHVAKEATWAFAVNVFSPFIGSLDRHGRGKVMARSFNIN